MNGGPPRWGSLLDLTPRHRGTELGRAPRGPARARWSVRFERGDVQRSVMARPFLPLERGPPAQESGAVDRCSLARPDPRLRRCSVRCLAVHGRGAGTPWPGPAPKASVPAPARGAARSRGTAPSRAPPRCRMPRARGSAPARPRRAGRRPATPRAALQPLSMEHRRDREESRGRSEPAIAGASAPPRDLRRAVMPVALRSTAAGSPGPAPRRPPARHASATRRAPPNRRDRQASKAPP